MPLAEAPRIIGFIYGLIVVFLVPWLLIRARLGIPVRFALASCALLSGILLFAPMTPLMFLAGLYQLKEFQAPLILVFGTFSFFVMAAFGLGRSFCGYACPVGAVQEIPYYLPIRKWIIRQSPLLLVIRAILISACIVLALLMVIYLFTVNLVLMRGVRDVFLLSSLSIPAVFFLAFIGFSVVLYRPFCRFACPYGALISIAAWKSIFRITRTTACTGCGNCEVACPTGETLPGHQGNECYLCGRCLDACPVRGAIAYTRRNAGRK
jgi:ferredoxin-type protein NapH